METATLTAEQVRNMEAGAEMDALIGERVMGLRVLGLWSCYSVEGCTEVDDEGAWKGSGYDSIRPVFRWPVEPTIEVPDADTKFVLGCPSYELSAVGRYSTDIGAALSALSEWQGDYAIRRQNGVFECTLFQPSREWESWAETLPLAVCRALLLAKL